MGHQCPCVFFIGMKHVALTTLYLGRLPGYSYSKANMRADVMSSPRLKKKEGGNRGCHPEGGDE